MKAILGIVVCVAFIFIAGVISLLIEIEKDTALLYLITGFVSSFFVDYIMGDK